MAFTEIGRQVYSLDYGWGTVIDISYNGNVGVRFNNDEGESGNVPSIVEWYTGNGERLAKIKTKRTLFMFPQEIIPVSMGSII